MSNGEWLALFKTSLFSPWQGAGPIGAWQTAKYIAEYCLYKDEEEAVQRAWALCKHSLEDEIKKAMK